jgi:serine/threonine-protein kinase
MVGHHGSVGRYRLVEQLGAGGFAAVYRAHDPLLKRDVALKLLHPHLARDPKVRERFLTEGPALARVKHPNVVQVFDAGDSDGAVYLTMELIDGRSLTDLVDELGGARRGGAGWPAAWVRHPTRDRIPGGGAG